MALYIFQFGLMQPFASIFNSQWPIAVFTGILFLIMILNNKFIVKKYVVIAFIILSMYFLFNMLIYQKGIGIILSVYVQFVMKGFTAFIIGSLDTDNEDLYRAFLIMAVLNFLVIAPFPFTSFLNSMNYMRFGYAMLPSVIMFLYESMRRQKLQFIWVLMGLIGLALTVVYGSRGPLIVLLLLAGMIFIFLKSITKKRKLIIGTTLILITAMILRYNLFLRAMDFIYFNMEIQSYAVSKLRMMLNVGLKESSSGRDVIYMYLISLIKENPIVGYGVGYSQMNIVFTAHNIILQILIESGIIGLLIWGGIWARMVYIYKNISMIKAPAVFKVVTLIISIALGRLLISSDMWLRPEYWFGLSMLYNINNMK